MKAFIISIGDELLFGNTTDTNSVFIARNLEPLDIRVVKKVAIADDKDEIINALNEAKQRADLIFITGGLGPTKDDITKKTLVEYFNSKLVLDEDVLNHVKALFAKRDRPLLQVNHDQALVPECAEVLFNETGTAPGMWIEKDGKIFISLPGVPLEVKHLIKERILPRLAQLSNSSKLIHKYIQTIGIGESAMAEEIKQIENNLPKDIRLAYLPSIAQVKLRLTGTGDDKELEQRMNHIVEQISEKLEKYIFSFEEEPIEQAIGKMLTANKETISLAESCTGGYIAHRLTLIPGSSAYFMGSFVTYDYDVKESVLGVKHKTLVDYGAVSEETVREMLNGCIENLNTTYGIAVSGIAGPGGGMAGKPVGTVYIGVGNKENQWIKRHHFRHDRALNIQRTCVAALNMLRIFMNKSEN